MMTLLFLWRPAKFMKFPCHSNYRIDIYSSVNLDDFSRGCEKRKRFTACFQSEMTFANIHMHFELESNK